MKKIMFDLDGVLVDFSKTFTAMLKEEFPNVPVLSQTEQSEWDFGIPGLWQKSKAWQEGVLQSKDFWMGLPPLMSEDERERLRHLALNEEVYFVTNRLGIDVKYQTEWWLRARGIYNPTVIISENKGEIARALDATFAIEDKAGNATYIAYHTKNRTKSYLIDRPYNQFNPKVQGSKVIRIYTLSQFFDAVEAA